MDHENLMKYLEEFRSIRFQPDFQKVDAERNVRYCEITDFPISNISFELLETGVSQQWRNCDQNLFNEYLKTYKNGGYSQFEDLLFKIWGYSEEKERFDLPALKSFYRKMSEIVGEDEVLEKLARLVRITKSACEVLPEKIYRLVGDIESATFSHIQCASLIAWMFFSDTPRLSFIIILQKTTCVAVEKLKFLFTYFDKMSIDPPIGAVSFRKMRITHKQYLENWKLRETNLLPDVQVFDKMSIEETALCTQIDFANKRLGGGVLKGGAVQEEIRFMMCPEMMVAILLNDVTQDLEAISIVGAYVFSSYTGYSNTLKWAKITPKHSAQNNNSFRDQFGRLQTETVAIDAVRNAGTPLECLLNQLTTEKLTREVRKAAIGFLSAGDGFSKIPVVSGWWGCGAFRGNKPLKFLIQVIACGISDRPLQFCTFGDTELAKKCEEMMTLFRNNNVRTGQLFLIINSIGPPLNYSEQYVFDAIRAKINSTKA